MRVALTGTMHDSLRPVLVAIILLYTAFGVGHWLTLPRPQGVVVALADVFSVILAVALWLGFGKLPRPSRLTYPIAAGINVLMLANVYMRAYVMRDAELGTTLLPLLVGAGFFYLWWPWVVASLAVGVTGWYIVASRVNDLAGVQEHTYAIMAAVSVALALHFVRVRSLRRLETLRQADERKAAELELALADSDRLRLAAEQASVAKSEFLSRMSHELRTPLTAILGFAQLLEMDTTVAPMQAEQIGHIHRAGQHLLKLIDEVLDLGKVESGNIVVSVESVAVGPLMRECLEITVPLAEARGIAVDADAPGLDGLSVSADRTRLRQVLLNLLSNAVKYNRDGGSIRIEGAQAGQRVRVTVSDTGIGMPADRMDELFQPFSRLGADLTEVKGSGIGLAISRKLVEAMQGTISAESTHGEGSAFTVDLPLDETV